MTGFNHSMMFRSCYLGSNPELVSDGFVAIRESSIRVSCRLWGHALGSTLISALLTTLKAMGILFYSGFMGQLIIHLVA